VPPLNVCLTFDLLPCKVRYRNSGAPGGGELHDRVFERGDVQEEDAHRRLAEEVLPADRPEVREARCGPAAAAAAAPNTGKTDRFDWATNAPKIIC